jgi:hypothetical protein
VKSINLKWYGSILNPEIKDPYWLAGFILVRGSFIIYIFPDDHVELIELAIYPPKIRAIIPELIKYLGCEVIDNNDNNIVIIRINKLFSRSGEA